MEDPGQIAAQDFKLAAGEAIRHACYLPVISIHNGDRADAGLHPLHLGQQPHALEHAHGCSAKVDGVSAGTHRRGTLDNGRMKSIPAQPEGQSRTGHARP